MRHRFKEKARKPRSVPSFLCRNRAELVRALTEVREHRGIPQRELDEIAGFSPGYTGKLECRDVPNAHGALGHGRTAVHPTFDWWLGALKVGVVVVPLDADVDLSVASRPRIVPPRMTVKRAEKIRALHAEGRSPGSLWRMFQTTPQMVDDILAGRTYMPVRA